MKGLIKRILKEYSDRTIQNINFDGFSEPILIPQFQKYIVKFNGTSKEEKIGESEKIIFKDNNTNKEYIFNSDDVQKSGSSPFYINLDVLRRHYSIDFKDDFVRYKKNLSVSEYNDKLKEIGNDYKSDGRCKTKRCEDLRNAIELSLKEMYGENYGGYVSSECNPTEGFLNVYPLDKTTDNNGNEWSKLNYVIFREGSASTLIIAYLKKYGTFEHKDFIQWVKDDKERLFKGPFLDLMFRNINLPKTNKILGDEMFTYIKNIFPKAKLIRSFCPTTPNTKGEFISISNNGKNIIFQPVEPKTKKVLNYNNKYFLFFGRRVGSPPINRNADYIITKNGTIFKNSNVLTGDRSWEFENPPIYVDLPYEQELKKYTKLK